MITLIAAALALPLAAVPSVASLQWLWIGLGGLVVVPFASILVTHGAHNLAAAEVAALMQLQTVIGLFWVWLDLAEQPGIWTMIGGTIVVTALFLHAPVRLRRAG